MNKNMRRPVWRPSLSSRTLAFLWKLGREQISLKRTILVVVLFPLGLYLYNESLLNPILIEPFSVPKRYEEAGLTAEAMSRLIADALRDLEERANSIMRKDRLALSSDPSSVPDIDVPGTKLGLRTVVEATRQVFGRDLMHVRGAIVAPMTSGPEVATSEVEITLRLVKGHNSGLLVKTWGPASDPPKVAQKAAEAILRQTNPYLLGTYRLRTKDFDDALKIAKELINDPPGDKREIAKAYLLWGNVLNDQGKYPEAIPLFEKATILDPKSALAYNNWGIALDNQGKPAEAIPLFEKATTFDPKYALAYLSWGIALYRQGKYAEAIPLYEKATTLDPKDAPTYNNWGIALNKQGKYAEAIPLYEKATTLDPKFSVAYNNWGVALDAIGKHTEAEQKRRKAAEAGQAK